MLRPRVLIFRTPVATSAANAAVAQKTISRAASVARLRRTIIQILGVEGNGDYGFSEVRTEGWRSSSVSRFVRAACDSTRSAPASISISAAGTVSYELF